MPVRAALISSSTDSSSEYGKKASSTAAAPSGRRWAVRRTAAAVTAAELVSRAVRQRRARPAASAASGSLATWRSEGTAGGPMATNSAAAFSRSPASLEPSCSTRAERRSGVASPLTRVRKNARRPVPSTGRPADFRVSSSVRTLSLSPDRTGRGAANNRPAPQSIAKTRRLPMRVSRKRVRRMVHYGVGTSGEASVALVLPSSRGATLHQGAGAPRSPISLTP